MGGALLWARALGRRRWAASVFLVLFAGLAGGAVMTAMGVARRTSTALDRYLRQPTLATKMVNACPVGLTEKDIESDPGTICSDLEDVLKVARLLRASPLVAQVTPLAVLLVGMRTDDIAPWGVSIQYAQLAGTDFPLPPIVVKGRLPRNDSPLEVAFNEALAKRLGISAGDTVQMASYTADQRFDLSAQRGNAEPAGTHTLVRVVGIVRTSDDLQNAPEAVVFTNAAWWKTYGGDGLAGYGKQSAVRLRDPGTATVFEKSLEKLLPGRVFQVQEAFSPTESSRRVIELQSGAAWAVAVAAGLAALAFFVQAINRQCGRDLADRATMTALGMTRRDVLAAVVLKSLPVAVGAGLVSAALAVLASPVGPVGLARRIEIAPGVQVDAAVVIGGAAAVILLTILASLAAAALQLRRTDRDAARPFVRRALRLPVSARAGLSFLRRHDRSALPGAVIGTAIAVALIIGATATAASHTALLAHPVRFGQTWQATAGDFGSDEERTAGEQSLAKVSGIAEYGQTRSTRAASIDGRPVFVFAFVRQGVGIGPTIVEGRAPVKGEVALGTRTLADHHLRLGDRVTLGESGGGSSVGPLTIVGRVLVNDGLETVQRSDDGALVSNDTFNMIDAPSIGQSFLIRAAPGVSTSELLSRLTAGFGKSVRPAGIPEDIANLDRVAAAPTLLAALVAVLAAAAMINTLLTVIARRRRDIGVLRALGFSRMQVVGSTAAMASALMFPAIVLGLLFGVIATRLGWSAVETRIGVESAAVLPITGILAAVLGTVVIAQLVALVPGIRAARARAVDALAAE